MGQSDLGSSSSSRSRLLDALRASGTTSRAELARRTGLSRTTISSLVGQLIDEGLVRETEPNGSAPAASGGRPPALVQLDRRAGCAVGLDFGKTHLTVAVADLGHEVLAERRVPLTGEHDAEADIALGIELFEETIAAADVARDAVIGVGLGLPGPVHQSTGTVGSGAILPGWVGVQASTVVSERLGLPVHVDNDANLGALAEHLWGAGRGATEMIYLKIATGIGAGFLFGGAVYAGVGGTAGEIGHMILDEDGPVCRCANRGCLETLASGEACVELLKPTLGDDLTVEQLIALTQQGEPAAERVVADAGRHIGRAVANLINVLNPRRVVVGGEMAACGDVLLEPLRAEALRHAIRSAADDVEVVPAQHGDRAEVLGALALVLLGAGELTGVPTSPTITTTGGAPR